MLTWNGILVCAAVSCDRLWSKTFVLPYVCQLNGTYMYDYYSVFG